MPWFALVLETTRLLTLWWLALSPCPELTTHFIVPLSINLKINKKQYNIVYKSVAQIGYRLTGLLPSVKTKKSALPQIFAPFTTLYPDTSNIPWCQKLISCLSHTVKQQKIHWLPLLRLPNPIHETILHYCSCDHDTDLSQRTVIIFILISCTLLYSC